MISLIAAIAKNNVIGHENDLPWYLPEDLKRFKALTMGKPVLMGRKTYDSIIKRLGKPLPGRVNIVVTRDSNYKVAEGVKLYTDLNRALEDFKDQDLFVIGGGQIFSQTIDKADKLYITHVDLDTPGDSYFPKIDLKKWKKTEEEPHENFTFVTYEKN